MSKWIAALAVILTFALVALGCSGGNPTTPIPGDCPGDCLEVSPQADFPTEPGTQQRLWGYYDVYMDIENQTVEWTVNRSAMFAANVVTFLNDNPANLSFAINSIYDGGIYLDIDLDVSITHPFPGLDKFDGYDVMGVFMGHGCGLLNYGNDLRYPDPGILDNQSMPGDPATPGGPDGFTRWFNAKEFTTSGLFGYTHGTYATPGYTPVATLCPYRYFADGLGATEDLWDFLSTTGDNGVFSSGKMNTRNYVLKFGIGPGSQDVSFGYAVVANWKGADPIDHPANAIEAVACRLDMINNLYYESSINNGGNVILDIDLFSWDEQPSQIYIDGGFVDGFISDVYTLNSTEMTPTSGGDHYSTYHVDIEADNLTYWGLYSLWIIAEYPDYDYSNDPGPPNDAEDELLAAFFRYNLWVSDEQPQGVICDVVVDPASPAMPYDGPPAAFTFDASGSYDVGGADLTFEWDFDNDGIFGDSYDSGTDEVPVKLFTSDNQEQVCVRVSNGTDESECCVEVDITIVMVDKNIPLREGFDAMDIAIDHADGDLLVLYSDGSVWKYTEAGNYQDGVQLYLTYEPGSQYIDIAPNSYSVVGFYEYNYADKCKMYDGGGGFISNGYISSQCWVHDVIAWTGHTYTNMMGVTTFSCPGGTWPNWKMHGPPNYDVSNYFWAYLTAYGCGQTALHRDIIKGTECGNISMQYVYYLEGGNGSCNEYRVQRVYRPSGSTLLNEAMWGGTRTDDMDGFWDPQDITRDIDNDFYILDILSTGDPLIKKYTEDGTEIGSFGDSASISGTPLRIEGSDYEGPSGNLMFVLHEDDPADLLSIYYPSEIPD